MRMIFLTIAFLLAVSLQADAQQRAQIFELGPQVTDNIKAANGYQWRAWGWVYARGSFANPKAACSVNESGIIGYWSAEGWQGNAAAHSARYRVTVYGNATWYFRGDVAALDGDGLPASLLYPLIDYRGNLTGGSVEYEPRSVDCFGGRVKVFLND